MIYQILFLKIINWLKWLFNWAVFCVLYILRSYFNFKNAIIIYYNSVFCKFQTQLIICCSDFVIFMLYWGLGRPSRGPDAKKIIIWSWCVLTPLIITSKQFKKSIKNNIWSPILHISEGRPWLRVQLCSSFCNMQFGNPVESNVFSRIANFQESCTQWDQSQWRFWQELSRRVRENRCTQSDAKSIITSVYVFVYVNICCNCILSCC